MKMSEINENLSEAPEAYGDKPNTMGKRFATKLKKHTPFSKKKRGEAEMKDKIFKQAKELKNNFAQFMQNDPAGKPTVSLLNKFFADTEYASYVKDVATKLNFVAKQGQPDVSNAEPEATNEPKPNAAVDNEPKVDAVDPSAEDEEMISPDEMTGKETDESVDEDADDSEPKTVSASIYESRLRQLLSEDDERTLTDNEVDTFLVRLIQKKNLEKSNASNIGDDAETTSDEEPSGKSSKGSKQSSSSSSGKISDEEFEAVADKIQDLRARVKKIITNAKIDEAIKKQILSEIDAAIVDVIDEIQS